MKVISAQDWELLSFFEVEPEYQDPTEPWPYTDALYRVQQGNIWLSVAIAPANRDVRIMMSVDGIRIYEFASMGVEDVRYVKEHGIETLHIIINEVDSMTLRLKPNIEINGLRSTFPVWRRWLALVQFLVVQTSLASFRAVS